MSVSFLLAMDRNCAIGYQNRLPWRLPADLAYVKQTTMGKTLLMGRKTFDSIGRPLPGRNNVVLTRDKSFQREGVTVVYSVQEALERFRDEELIVFGGAEVFELFMPYVDKLYITYIDEEFEADTYFPDMDLSSWRLVSNVQGVKDEKNPYTYFFRVYEKP